MAGKGSLRAAVTVLFLLLCLAALCCGADRLLSGAQPVADARPMPPAVMAYAAPSVQAPQAQAGPEESESPRAPALPLLACAALAAMGRLQARRGRDRNGNVLQGRSYMRSMHQAFSFSDGGA